MIRLSVVISRHEPHFCCKITVPLHRLTYRYIVEEANIIFSIFSIEYAEWYTEGLLYFLFSQVGSRYSCLLLVYIHFEKCLKMFLWRRKIIYKTERKKKKQKEQIMFTVLIWIF